jgi:glycosyltransferase involved in cell wall biosynthesis
VWAEVSAQRPHPASPQGPLDARWRAAALEAQSLALPGGHVSVSCPAPFGSGGLGRHLEEIAEALQRRDDGAADIFDLALEPAPSSPPQAGARPRVIDVVAPLARFAPAWRMWLGSTRFDARAARLLPRGGHLIAFNGTALAQLGAARRAGLESASLMSANSHMRRVLRQHDRAHRAYPVERPWATHLLARNLREYAAADRIHVASRYVWESFVEEGVPEERLSMFPLTPHPRFRPAEHSPAAETFDVVYVGSLQVHKGVPLLLDAFSRLAHADMRLVLVGGWKTRGMRRLLEEARARDPRIVVAPGDALARLQGAGVCVHPAYEDGFAYAPAEALACGVPVIVSEDTGMKELLEPGRTGVIVPTGERDALVETLEAAYRGDLLGG